MKKAIAGLLAILLLSSCSHLRELDSVDPIVYGSWVGEGRFYDRDLAGEYGKFSVKLEIHPDDSVTGTVGDAPLVEGVVKGRPRDFLIEARLSGPALETGSLPDEHKDCVVIILKPPEGSTITGDIHLKTNLTFDFSMRAGELTLSRVP